MSFPIKVDSTLRDKMADVERAFNARAYFSAIALSLTLPDVCGCFLFPNEGVGERYAKWFDSYVAWHYIVGTNVTDGAKVQGTQYYFSGTDCYQLRCVYLHEGSNAPHVEHGKTIYNAIQFRIFDGEQSCDHIGEIKGDISENGCGTNFRQVDLDLKKFIGAMDTGISKFLDEYPDANDSFAIDSILYTPILDFRTSQNGSAYAAK